MPAAGIQGARGNDQVFAHGQALEDAPSLRNERDAARRDQFRRQPRDVGAENFDRAGACREQADHHVHAGGFAGAVAAE
jgi:hypothetical protein